MFGLIPYGSDDPDVVFRRSLTVLPTQLPTQSGDVGALLSAPALTDAGGGGNAHTFTAAGFTPNGTALYLAGIPNWYTLDSASQIYFEVDKNVLATADATSQGASGGYSFSAAQYILAPLADAYDGNSQSYFNVAGAAAARQVGYLAGNTGTGAAQSRSGQFNDVASGAFVPVVIANNGLTLTIYIDGVILGTVTKNSASTGWFKNLLIARHPLASGAGNNMTVGSIRNLQVSRAKPSFRTTPSLALVAPYGDSYAQAPLIWQSVTGQVNCEKSLQCRKALNAAGYDFTAWNSTFTYGGATIQGYQSDALAGGATGNNLQRADRKAALIAAAPSAVIIQAGANDLTNFGGLGRTNAMADLKELVKTIMGVDAYAPLTTVRGLVICTTPYTPNYPSAGTAAQRLTDLQYLRDRLLELPLWWDSTYRGFQGRVVVQDLYTDLGGAVGDGSYWGAADALHPSPKGAVKFGASWAEGLLKLPTVV